MENREVFTGISAKPEESVDEVNWKNKNYNSTSRGRGYFNKGTSRGQQRNNNYQPNTATKGRGYNSYGNNFAKKTGTANNQDVRCLLCGLKGHKVATCRKLARAQELIRLDKQQYWNKKKEAEKGNTSRHARHQINEVDKADSVNKAEYQFDEEDINMDCNGLDGINFPYSEFTEEEDLAYYDDN